MWTDVIFVKHSYKKFKSFIASNLNLSALLNKKLALIVQSFIAFSKDRFDVSTETEETI